MISIDEITRISEKRNRLKKETYVKIYNQISKRIRQSVDLGHKYLFCQVPSFVMGCPHFDRPKATQYIKRQFEIGGFTVQQIGEYELCISWKPLKKSKTHTQNVEEDMTDFPTLINLKKAANKYRGSNA
jgi:hypothetical protein